MSQLLLRTISSFILSVFILQINAQNHSQFCGTDEMHQQLFKDYPRYNEGIKRSNERLQAFTIEYSKQPKPKSGNPYIIPIVFHIIHNYGAENIGDAQIHDAVKQINLQFRKLNPDTSQIVSSFQSIAADCEIEFRLAQLDPDGNCTSGITRTVSPLTAIGDHQVKSLIQWPPDKYLNVYICNQAAGLAGHALLPSAADTIPQWDGIVMQHSYIGTIGTSEYFRRTVLTHEIGHFLNLQHIWGGNNVPDYYYLPVAQAGNCAYDDDVTDTPLTIGWQSCNLSGSSCSSLDNVQNYMDYAYCALMFTEGQKTRMHACLNSTVASRNNLWSMSNLISTGTDDSTFYLCQAKFETDKRIACVGETITLTDVSTHGIDSRLWDIPGGLVSSTSDSVITVSFLNPGTYSVSLEVFNGVSSIAAQEISYITILPLTGTNSSLHEHFESVTDFQDNWVIVPKDSPLNWFVTNEAGYNSSNSITVQNFDQGSSTSYEFISQPFDASGLPAIALSFDFAYAQKQTVNIEQMSVSVSKDCGDTWLIRKVYYGSTSLKTVDTLVTTAFIPADSTQWRQDIISNITSAYLTDNLQFKFKFDAKGGNNIYIDNIRIADPAILGINTIDLMEIEVYPNPVNEMLNVRIPDNIKLIGWKMYDLPGNLVISSLEKQNSNFQISVIDLKAGMYVLELNSEFGLKRIRVVVN